MDIKVWGNNIWYLFHTIAYKIKEDEFNNIKQDLFYIVKTICQNLPCPECSEHATNLLKKVNFDNISNKQEFKILLFNFHNTVNKKLNKPLFKEEELDPKYKNANIYNLYTNFNIIFTNNNTNPLMMSNNFKKKIDYPIIKDKLNNLLKYME